MLATRSLPSRLVLITVAIWGNAARAEVLDPLDFTSLGTLILSGGNFTIDTDALTIVDNAAPGVPLFTGVIDDQSGLADSFGPGGDVTTVGPLGVPHIAAFAFDGITIETSANITVTGHRALALLSQGDALVNTTIDVSGSGEPNGHETTGRAGGPGGFAGGTGLEAGFGPGGGASAGTPTMDNTIQGGSGGFGGRGGEGYYLRSVPVPPGGPAYGDLTGVLQAGSGGGGGGDINPQFMVGGGGGGGALEIGATRFLEIGASASLLADGGFGQKDALSIERGGGGSGGGVRLHGRELRLQGSISATGTAGGSDILNQHQYGGGGGGRVLLAGSRLVFLVGSAPPISEFTIGIDVADWGFENSMFGVIGHVPLVTVVPGSQSFELGTVLSLQAATGQQPGVEVIPHDLSVFGEVTVPAGGATYTHAIELKTAAARLTGADPLTNQGTVSGSGRVEVAFINDAGSQVNATNNSLTFTQAVTNDAGGQINAINSTLDFQAGLTNSGQLNLINTTILGSITGGAGGAASFVGDNSVGGNLTMAAGDSLAIRLGGTAPVQFDSLVAGGDLTIAGSLSVLLTNGFTLEPGQSFPIVDVAGAAAGSFASLTEGSLVGTFNGTDLFITYAAGDGNDVALFTQAATLSGDYNTDGAVDAADYVVWRKSNIDGPQGYAMWRANFGRTSTTDTFAMVPEPSSAVSWLLIAFLVASTPSRIWRVQSRTEIE